MTLSTAPGRIAELIRSLIIEGTFPPGSQVTESQLAERLSVSRGPIREAMQRLVQEGLLWTKPHHGTFVVDLGRDDVADIYLARRAVESTAVVRVIGKSDAATLDALDDAVGKLRVALVERDWTNIVKTDLHFHELIVAAAGSKRLSRMFSTLLAETTLCMTALVDTNVEWPDQAAAEHADLVAAMRSGDTALATALVDRHFVLDNALDYRGVLGAAAAKNGA